MQEVTLRAYLDARQIEYNGAPIYDGVYVVELHAEALCTEVTLASKSLGRVYLFGGVLRDTSHILRHSKLEVP
jgi:hypothetical protein